jgi:hypothetical protein
MSLDDDLLQVQDFSFAIISFNMIMLEFHTHISQEFSGLKNAHLFLTWVSTTKIPSKTPRTIVLSLGNFFIFTFTVGNLWQCRIINIL